MFIRILVFAITVYWGIRSLAEYQTQCQVLEQPQSLMKISSLRIQNQGSGKGRLSLITQTKDQMEVIHSEGSLKSDGKLLAFVGDSKIGRTTLIVKENTGTVTVQETQLSVLCKDKIIK